MDSMHEPTNNGERINDTIEVADGHLVHLCCGKLDAEEHRNFCEHYRLPDLSPDETTEYGKGWADGYRAGMAASPAQRLIDETAERWAAENRKWLA